MVALVQRTLRLRSGQVLDLHQQLAAAKVPQTHTMLQRQITATDNQIDKLVYELYDLTTEEIEIVEGRKVAKRYFPAK